MSNSWQLSALMKKNFILMKRNYCLTICEILFPILLMILLILVRRAIKTEEYNLPADDLDYLRKNSTALIETNNFKNITFNNIAQNFTYWNGLRVRNPLSICGNRQGIAAIGKEVDILPIKNKISNLFLIYPNKTYKFVNFESVKDVDLYIKDTGYGVATNKPELCFGFYFNEIDQSNFNYSLLYFDTSLRGGNNDVPTTLRKSLDPFQVGPDMSSYEKWLLSGYLQIFKIINDRILQIVTNNENGSIEFGVMAQKYTTYKNDPFSNFIGGILPFFLIIAYTCPLCIMVFRMVQEKESRAKEGMKIMGLSESVYFLSFFLHWLILNSVYSIINSLILTRVFTNIGLLYILGFFWLFGMTIFSLAYFFQAMMDKTRIAMIISILVYYIMYFVSVAVLSEDVDNTAKMLMSLLPPTSLQLGINVLAKFESSFKPFRASEVGYKWNNYSVGDMYLMLFIDIFLYLFLGYYLQNVLTHQFGMSRPFYFLCTSSFWCKKKNKITSRSIEDINEKYVRVEVGDGIQKENFQDETNYESKIKSGESLQISNLKKEFEDGKVAVDGLNLNLYKEEIFALLGHNGAGKSTTISILCGLYEATSGRAMYNGNNILEEDNMVNFRKKLGICPQHDVLFENLTVAEHLNMFCIFKGVDSDKIEKEIEKILHDVHMYDKKDELSKNLSGGQKRKLSIAIALIGGSEIVFLDEPSSGMDITSRRNLWEILKKCIGNRIIVLTTHYMEEAAVLGNRIGIVSNGKLKCCGNSLFLINRYGKYLSLNIYKLPDAADEEIIQFVRERVPDVEFEILSEEILFRIPKIEQNQQGMERNQRNFSFKAFFNELDTQVERLKIKSYSASMPTLEDVFLNVSSDSTTKIAKSNDGEVFKTEELEIKKTEIGGCSKFIIDLKTSIKKRFLQIIRDKKSFLLEILCPIILVLIGLGVSSVQFIKDSPAITVGIDLLPTGQRVVINSNYYNGNKMNIQFKTYQNLNVTYDYQQVTNGDNLQNTFINYNNLLQTLNYTNSYGSFYIINFDTTNHKYQYVTFVNTEARNAPIIYSQYMMNQIHNLAAGREIKINYDHHPFPLTDKLRSQGETRNNSNLVFFVSIAFALIPANFITIIIKERETNTKHLQIISGISVTSYWLSNFIFELVKYYFIGGINLLLILAFNTFPPYLWLLYLLYGFSMTAFTYMLSLFFIKESSAQNTVILINCLFGALGGSVILILRILEDLIEIGKVIAYILRVVPSFAFSYGFNQLLSAQLLFVTDYPKDFIVMTLNTETYIIKPEYVGADAIYLVIEFGVYMLVLIILEATRNCCRSKKIDLENFDFEAAGINDSQVISEILKPDQKLFDESKYSIIVKKLEKVYSNGCMSGKYNKAVNKLSFSLEFGECFALLGVNGAGKTTTFKALTCELLPTGGEIYINGLEVTSNFHNIRNLIGYCPQFDAIFEYMTVYENLEFYANLKGIHPENTDRVVTTLIKEMNLTQYRDKISGNLSGGNKRKLSVAIAMIGNPPIVLLDEPSTGMDPEARRFMWAVIHNISKRSKKSSVILTTHSMEEAETLCRRMGIMVSGQFKCLGTGQVIKDKYGTGYEISLRIQNMSELLLNQVMLKYNLDYQTLTSNEQVENILNTIGKSNWFTHINPKGIGREIYDDINIKGRTTVKRVIEWTFYTECTLKSIAKLLSHFEDISIAEFWDNNYQLKIKKNENTNRIGFLFGFMEDLKEECFLSEYSISQTSLEQIFNKFASENDEEVLNGKTRTELTIDNNLIKSLLG